MGRSRENRLAEVIGRSTILLLWVAASYLSIHYAVLLLFGADRLHAILGGQLYNALIPMGGFNLILLVMVLGVAWGTPLIVAAGVAAGVLHMVCPTRPFRLRLAISTLSGLLLTASLPFVLLDGWPDPLWALVFGDDTEFASGYSAWGYWTVRPGMTQAEVLGRVGEPLERYLIAGTPGQEGWRWTRSPHDSSYRIRAILFSHGRVTERHSEFYVD